MISTASRALTACPAGFRQQHPAASPRAGQQRTGEHARPVASRWTPAFPACALHHRDQVRELGVAATLTAARSAAVSTMVPRSPRRPGPSTGTTPLIMLRSTGTARTALAVGGIRSRAHHEALAVRSWWPGSDPVPSSASSRLLARLRQVSHRLARAAPGLASSAARQQERGHDRPLQ